MKKCDSHKTFDVFVHYAVHGWIYQCTVFLIGTLLRIAAVAQKLDVLMPLLLLHYPCMHKPNITHKSDRDLKGNLNQKFRTQ